MRCSRLTFTLIFYFSPSACSTPASKKAPVRPYCSQGILIKTADISSSLSLWLGTTCALFQLKSGYTHTSTYIHPLWHQSLIMLQIFGQNVISYAAQILYRSNIQVVIVDCEYKLLWHWFLDHWIKTSFIWSPIRDMVYCNMFLFCPLHTDLLLVFYLLFKHYKTAVVHAMTEGRLAGLICTVQHLIEVLCQ